MPENEIFLIVGLGNPGEKYKNTRHNAGFMVIDSLSENYSIPLNKKKFNALFGKGKINNKSVILAKPLSYMNKSGIPVQNLADFFKISISNMIVIHDDLDIPYKKIKIKKNGGHGGHNGIKSLINSLGGKNFTRIRFGIGRPNSNIADKDYISDYVLKSFNTEEKKTLDEQIDTSKDAVVTTICEGINISMNIFNKKAI